MPGYKRPITGQFEFKKLVYQSKFTKLRFEMSFVNPNPPSSKQHVSPTKTARATQVARAVSPLASAGPYTTRRTTTVAFPPVAS